MGRCFEMVVRTTLVGEHTWLLCSCTACSKGKEV